MTFQLENFDKSVSTCSMRCACIDKSIKDTDREVCADECLVTLILTDLLMVHNLLIVVLLWY